VTDFFDEVAPERYRGADFAIARGLRNIVGGAQRQRAQADLGIPPRQRRRHDHNEIASFFKQQREGSDAVELGHINIEHDDVGDDALELIYGLTAGAKRGNDFKIGFGFDPAGKQPADDDGIVDQHDADTPADCVRGGGRWRNNEVHWTGLY